MSKKTRIIISLLAGMVGVLLIISYVVGVERRAVNNNLLFVKNTGIPSERVVVASKDIKSGSVIMHDMLSMKEIKSDSIMPMAISGKEDVIVCYAQKYIYNLGMP